MTTSKWMSLVLAAALLAGCDPYDDEDTSQPRIVRVQTSNGYEILEFTAGEEVAPGQWRINAPSACDAGDVIATQPQIWINLSNTLNGDTVQTAIDDCTPAGDWLTATAAGAGEAWYSCYSPGGATDADRASIVLFLAPAGGTSGWYPDEIISQAGSADNPTAYVLTGTVKDKQGRDIPVDLTVNVLPNPGDVGAVTFTGTTAAGTTLNWTAPACGTASTRYRVERAPNVENDPAVPADDAPGTYAVVSPAGGVDGLTFTDSGLTAGTIYWYRVTTVAASGTLGDAVEASVTTAP